MATTIRSFRVVAIDQQSPLLEPSTRLLAAKYGAGLLEAVSGEPESRTIDPTLNQ